MKNKENMLLDDLMVQEVDYLEKLSDEEKLIKINKAYQLLSVKIDKLLETLKNRKN